MSSSNTLTQAVTSGDESAVSALLAEGVNVNETTGGGQSALILAVIFGRTNLVRLLVKAGADPHLRDNLGLNALEWAQRRGLTEALGILTTTSPTTTPGRIVVNIEQPEERVSPPPATEPEKPEPVDKKAPSDEKSRRWVSGLKQRLDEMEVRNLNRDEARPPRAPLPEPQPAEEPPQSTMVATKEAPIVETKPATPPPASTQPVTRKDPPTGRILTPAPDVPSGKRKRCPQCNAIYNSDLLSYCVHHVVPLVDADEPIVPPPFKENSPLFWIMVVITLISSIVLGSLITAYLYKTNQADARSTAAPQPTIQTGSPQLSAELANKAVLLPEAQCPLNGPEAVSGTVIVRVLVDRKGQVSWAKGSGGDWLMR
ncbi:MAG TPA: ankyrin repeat domain-containing protein, partial [Pyrinomonadaceae bacterium]